MIKNQKGFTAIEIIVVVVALLSIGTAVYFAIKSNQNSTVSTKEKSTSIAKTSPSASPVVNNPGTGSEYTLNLPNGWKKVAVAPDEYSGKLGNGDYFIDANGNYFAVYSDLKGTGFTSDSTWETTRINNGFTVAKKTNCVDGPFCSAGDGQYRIGIKGGMLAGNEYFFLAGNTKKEADVSDLVYETILESLKPL